MLISNGNASESFWLVFLSENISLARAGGGGVDATPHEFF